MKDYLIEKGVPLPHRNKWPFKDMEVGDSILFDLPTGTVSNGLVSIRQTGKRFALRTLPEGVRVWRTE